MLRPELRWEVLTLNVVQTLDLHHADNKKQREWNLYDYGIADKLLELLEKNFPHYLYKDSSHGLADVKDEKSFELSIYTIRQEGDNIAVQVPSKYFINEGYKEIVSFIDKQTQ